MEAGNASAIQSEWEVVMPMHDWTRVTLNSFHAFHIAWVAALQKALANGTSYGAPTYLENELAELVIDMVPSIDMIRFVNSGGADRPHFGEHDRHALRGGLPSGF